VVQKPVKLNSELAHFGPLGNYFLDLHHVDPAVDEVYDLQHWELQLDFVLLLESFPLLPILQPFSEQLHLAVVSILMIRR
jgi:hypothetical protein